MDGDQLFLYNAQCHAVNPHIHDALIAPPGCEDQLFLRHAHCDAVNSHHNNALIALQDVKISYPCIMLNVMLVDHNTNAQYQTLVDPEKKVWASFACIALISKLCLLLLLLWGARRRIGEGKP